MRRVALPLAVAGLALATPAAGAAGTGRLLVSLRPDASGAAHTSAATAVMARAGARRAAPSVPQIGLAVVRPAHGGSLGDLARRLRADPRVRAVSAEQRATLRRTPNDPALAAPETASGTPPGTPVEWWPVREDFPAAWDITTGANALVGIIDTGIDANHPDLNGKIRRTEDLDANASHGPGTTDEVGHGTHVASLACAAADNGVGMVGAGYDCGLLVEKSDLSDGSVARALVSAADAGADAINMSFGTDGRTAPPQPIADALDYAYDHGIVLVAAAADDAVEEQGDPANYLQPTGTGPSIDVGKGLVVTAATIDDRRASYAGLGSQISLAAYGTIEERSGPPGLLGAFPAQQTELERSSFVPPSPACRCRASFQGDDRYAYLQGTSMAAPQVAAVGALIRKLNPDLPIQRVLRIVKASARPAAGGGWSPDLGWGILDAGAAVRTARDTDLRAPTSTVSAPSRTRGRSITLRLRGRDGGPPGVAVSGVGKYRVYRSTDGRRPVKIAVTRRAKLKLKARRGARYAFYVQAVDKAGNVQAFPAKPGARTRVIKR
jgi:subtilisin family serine protease